MASDSEDREQVEVLYDYSYTDDQGLVEIHEGEVYRLLERTNSEWWHVYSVDEDDGFFVPAQYVRVIKGTLEGDQEVNNALSSLDDVLGNEEETNNENSSENIVSSSVNRSQGKGSLPTPHTVNGMGTDTDSGAEYMNLDLFRKEAKMPPLGNESNQTCGDVAESDYANLPFQLRQQQEQQQQQQKSQQGQEQGPQLSEGQFVRVLVEGLPWDMYLDKSKRRFFHNRDTGELTWKPPRKEKPSSPVGTGPACGNTPSPTSSSSSQPPSFPGTPSSGTGEVPPQDEYTKTEEGGDVFFVNNSTSEKWQQLTDQTGRQYYHRLGSNDTQWDLPFMTQRSASEGQEVSPRNGETMSVEGGSAPSFTIRPMSMYGKIERVQPSAGDPKCSTLPPNFSPGLQVEKSPSLPSFQTQPPNQLRFEDQLCGYLNKTKISDIGKKKIKKSWGQTYMVLQSTNLVFYKDQKAAAQKPSSPHGRPEGVISLLGAKVDFNPPKEITSRRNTIMLSASSGSQFLLHSDDEVVIREWFVRLKVVANDISKEPSPREQDGSLGRRTLRTISEGGADSGAENQGERLRNMLGIKAKLLGFLNRRPTREDLVKEGIIQDAVFGSTLQSLCERDKSPVPNFVLECISAVESKGLDHDGIYRISGNLAEIQRLRYVVDKDDDHNLTEQQWDIHTLTGALKLFFRELKEPLFPFKCVDKFLTASKKETRKEKMKAFKDALSSLPKVNHDTMRVLFQHLKNVVQHSAENRMQTQNVAIVFGPTLMWMDEGDFSNMAILTIYQSKVVEFLLLEYDSLFK
ncbi:rho GTPase-activating protein 12-like isoform X2 [Babylonia areolata]|uniref:rho GTPase-activating protein 12-like isoform X2 n=1 Tax=Babylonia areolata TaxID=304850 RepID=UPI003FD047B3